MSDIYNRLFLGRTNYTSGSIQKIWYYYTTDDIDTMTAVGGIPAGDTPLT